VDQQAAGALQQHRNCCCNEREPLVVALRVALGLVSSELVSSEREQRELNTPPQKLRMRIRTAFVTAFHFCRFPGEWQYFERQAGTV
jgi:hypothetical protein